MTGEVIVSVIIPTFNRAQLLREAVGSVLGQVGCPPLEAIIVDDGSTDETSSVAEQLMRTDPRVRYCPQARSGPASARNRGLHEARGEYVQFLDSDDVLAPTKLQEQLAALRQCAAAKLCYCTVRPLTPGSEDSVPPIGASDKYHPDLALSFLGDFAFPSLSPVYRREACLAIGGWDTSLQQYEDWEFNFRMGLLDRPHCYTPQTLAFVRQHSGERLSGMNHPDAVRSYGQYLNRVTGHVLTLAPHRSDLLARLCRLFVVVAVWHYRLGLVEEGSGCLRQAIEVGPTGRSRGLARMIGAVFSYLGHTRAIAAYDLAAGGLRCLARALGRVRSTLDGLRRGRGNLPAREDRCASQ